MSSAPASAPTSAPSSAPSSTPGTPSSRKSNAAKCAHSASGCTDKVVKIVGDCRYCSQKFCAKHRLPEAHQCQNMQSCRDASAAKNANRLLQEKCVAGKV